MYEQNRKFDVGGKDAKKVRRVLDYLIHSFPVKTPELERYNVIILYCLVSTLIEKYVHYDTEQAVSNWFIKFETARRKQDALPEEERDSQLIEYRRLTS